MFQVGRNTQSDHQALIITLMMKKCECVNSINVLPLMNIDKDMMKICECVKSINVIPLINVDKDMLMAI